MNDLGNNKICNNKPKITLIKSIENLLPLGTILHFLFFILFYIKGVIPLVYFNIFSIIIYIYTYIFLIKKHFFISCIIIFFEILIHSILCILYIGWTGGFYVYPLCLLPIAYFVSINLTKKQKIGHICAIFILGNYQFWNIYSKFLKPKYNYLFIEIDGILYNFNTSVACIIIMILLCSVLYEMNFMQEMLEKRNKILDNLANFDSLTQLKNRRCMLEEIKNEFEIYENTNKRFFIAIGDIDNFKFFNDTYGHDCGDLVLKEVSNIFIKNCNKFCIDVSRWGGEEFLILIKYEDKGKVKEICETILNEIRNLKVLYKENNITITMTIGCTGVSDLNNTIDEVLKQADVNLYEGKKGTKNCIVLK